MHRTEPFILESLEEGLEVPLEQAKSISSVGARARDVWP
jgi:hypothetical protein